MQHKNFPAVLELSSLNGTNGFTINGITSWALFGVSVSAAGDVNGDNIADIIIGVLNLEKSYVVFGSKNEWPSVMNTTQLNGTNGFTIKGIKSGDESGASVGGPGDINGDGIDDILVEAPDANNYKGQSYVVFGSKSKWPDTFYLSDINGTNGFIIDGTNGMEFAMQSGVTVSGVGDVNNDGILDILIGSAFANVLKGQSYIVFGSKTIWPTTISVSDLDGTNGFAINGITYNDASGRSVSRAGDINGDGIADVLIGAIGANSVAGQSYVVFGNSSKWPATINLSDLNGVNGFAINGINSGDSSGNSVSGLGDINGDGVDDILIGAKYARNYIGQSYVIFGSHSAWTAVVNLTSLNGTNGFTINGDSPDASGSSVSGAGDLNGDNLNDILIGAPQNYYNNGAGRTYVIFGSKSAWPASVNLTNLNGTNGFVINGINVGDWCGLSVSRAGDVNHDGVDDILIGAEWANNELGQSYVVFGIDTNPIAPQLPPIAPPPVPVPVPVPVPAENSCPTIAIAVGVAAGVLATAGILGGFIYAKVKGVGCFGNTAEEDPLLQ